MRKFLIGLAAASIVAAASAPNASAQVTGIRHSDGSWTYVDKNGRDIHADYYAKGQAQYRDSLAYPEEGGRVVRRHRKGHKVGWPQ